MAGQLRDDQIKWILSLDVKGVQSELTGLSSKSIQLTNDNKKLSNELKVLEKDMDNLQKHISKLAASGDTGSEKLNRLKKTFSEVADDANDLRYQIAENKKSIDEYDAKSKQLIQTMRIEDMTMNQLRQKANELEKQLKNTSISADLAAYNQLEQELSTVRNRMGELGKGTQDTEKIFGLFSSGATKAIGLFVAALATAKAGFEAFKDIMLSNKATGVEFQATMDGIGNAVDYAKTAIANMDFTNFIEGMSEAYRIGKKVSIMLDELFERENSFKLTSAPIKADIEELKTQLRDANLPYEERLKIGQQIIEKTKELAALEKDVKQQAVDANIKLLESQTNLTDAEREYVVTNYNANRDQILFAKEIIALENKKAQFKDGFTQMEI